MAAKEISCQYVSVPNAAKEIGCSADYLRQMMKHEIWDLGEVVPPQKKGGMYRYLIFRAKLDKKLGLERKNEEENT